MDRPTGFETFERDGFLKIMNGRIDELLIEHPIDLADHDESSRGIRFFAKIFRRVSDFGGIPGKKIRLPFQSPLGLQIQASQIVGSERSVIFESAFQRD